MKETVKLIPRKIWMLWFQGLENAPLVVKKCVESWVIENPDWEVIVLDNNTLSSYIDFSEQLFSNLCVAHKSDLVRLHLLSKYGGVWADATTLCMRPLDEWIDDCAISGFFAFEKPGPDRIIANWFLAAQYDSPVVSILKNDLASFWLENNYSLNTEYKQKKIRLLNRALNKSSKTARFWFSPIVTKLLKVYPYFVFHYMFERVVSKNRVCKKIWKETEKIEAHPSLLIKRHDLFSSVGEEIKNEIDNKITAVYKLKWNFDQSEYQPSTLLYYLLEGRLK